MAVSQREAAAQKDHERIVAKLEEDLKAEETKRISAEQSVRNQSDMLASLRKEKEAKESELSDLKDQIRLMASTPASSSETGSPSGMQTFSPGGFRLDPYGFRVAGIEARSGGRTWHHLRGPGTASIIVEVEPYDNEDPTRRMKRVETKMSEQNYRRINMDSYATFKGMDAAKWEFSDVQDGKRVTKYILYTKSGTTGFRLIAVSTSDEWSSRRPTLLSIVNSFSP
jgi:chromosome segregation ATPase